MFQVSWFLEFPKYLFSNIKNHIFTVHVWSIRFTVDSAVDRPVDSTVDSWVISWCSRIIDVSGKTTTGGLSTVLSTAQVAVCRQHCRQQAKSVVAPESFCFSDLGKIAICRQDCRQRKLPTVDSPVDSSVIFPDRWGQRLYFWVGYKNPFRARFWAKVLELVYQAFKQVSKEF
jgi:hypothetical protein